jgi:methylenetetrahydrofolate dehydrogenase (NADP+)/methenyltetrahydrofolate cyclohydrolase
VAEAVLAATAARVARLRSRGITPSLATVLVGDDDASAGYIRIKQRRAAELGLASPHEHLPANHPLNMGRLAVGLPGPLPCTPAGIEALLAHHAIPVAGRELVILDRGATLGRPLATLLSQKRPTANAAVTVVHTGVPDWPRCTRRADRPVRGHRVRQSRPPSSRRPLPAQPRQEPAPTSTAPNTTVA